MPAFEAPAGQPGSDSLFPPVSRDHILNCSYDSWFPKYRTSCVKSCIIPLPQEFIDYLEEDGIFLADDDKTSSDDGNEEDEWVPSNPDVKIHRPPVAEHYQYDSDSDSDDDDDNPAAPPRVPPNRRFPALHRRIQDEIAALGGIVAPKLNWSAPRDATNMLAEQNTIKCRTANDIYTVLKSSSFVSHDLNHAFDGCVPISTPVTTTTTTTTSATNTTTTTSSSTSPSSPSSSSPRLGYNPVLVLRAYFPIDTRLEFRCFVKHRNLVAISPRDMKRYAGQDKLRGAVVARVRELFNARLRFTFPDDSFVFDVYLPQGEAGPGSLQRARLIDINPWAPRTDPLLFGWPELLDLHVPDPIFGVVSRDGDFTERQEEEGEEDDDDDEDEDEEVEFEPELRLVESDHPSAMNLSSENFSAHKWPREAVDGTLSALGRGGASDALVEAILSQSSEGPAGEAERD